MIENLLTASAHLPEVAFVAKLHRKDNPRYYQELEDRHPAQQPLDRRRAGQAATERAGQYPGLVARL